MTTDKVVYVSGMATGKPTAMLARMHEAEAPTETVRVTHCWCGSRWPCARAENHHQIPPGPHPQVGDGVEPLIPSRLVADALDQEEDGGGHFECPNCDHWWDDLTTDDSTVAALRALLSGWLP